jgi:hypothetical protein
MAQFRPVYANDPGPRFEQCMDEAQALMRRAADEWAHGDPENPPTERVLAEILQVFARDKFLKRPFGAGPT